MTKHSPRPRPSVRIHEDPGLVDVQAFARQYVQVLLANEQLVLTPTRLAEAS